MGAFLRVDLDFLFPSVSGNEGAAPDGFWFKMEF
jgi:hypothetical protein